MASQTLPRQQVAHGAAASASPDTPRFLGSTDSESEVSESPWSSCGDMTMLPTLKEEERDVFREPFSAKHLQLNPARNGSSCIASSPYLEEADLENEEEEDEAEQLAKLSVPEAHDESLTVDNRDLQTPDK